jgi:preprotein translocase subunit SecF
MKIFKNPNYDFVRWTWPALALSWIIILAGGLYIWKNGIPKGVEFSGGTIVVLDFEQTPDLDKIRAALPGGGANAVVQTYGPADLKQVMIRVPDAGAESGGSLSAAADAVVSSINAAGLGPISGTCTPQKPANCIGKTEIVGPTVGRELAQRGLLAMVFALGGILVYIALRFRISFAVGAVIATIHDLLITVVFLAVFNFELSLNVIAALLTITGYSMNDTIVIFDRVRENMRSMRRDNVATVINAAVNQMMDRTVITGGSTLLAVTALYFFGGEVLKSFAFTMIVGIITGTYSSVFIASAIVVLWQRGAKGPKAPAAPVAPTAPTKKAGKRARAS